MTRFGIAAGAALLAGCASIRDVPTQSISPQLAALIQKQDDKKCSELGLQPGTDGYAQCRLKLEEFHREDVARNAQWSAEEQVRQEDRERQALRDWAASIQANAPKTTITNTTCNTMGTYGATSIYCRGSSSSY